MNESNQLERSSSFNMVE